MVCGRLRPYSSRDFKFSSPNQLRIHSANMAMVKGSVKVSPMFQRPGCMRAKKGRRGSIAVVLSALPDRGAHL